MSDPAAGFARYVPGFDFLQNLAKGASQSLPQMPSFAQWVAPTMDVEELDKRINDLKAVQFWLDQNARALAATVQALEVQKLTLSTLKDMNVGLGDMAKAFQFGTGAADAAPDAARGGATEAAAAPATPPPPAPAQPARKAAPKSRRKPEPAAAAAQPAPARLVDPLQLWGALTQQFQQIATAALKDTAQGLSATPAAAAAKADAGSAKPRTASAKRTTGGRPAARRARASTPR